METCTIMISKVLNMICKVKIMTGNGMTTFGQKVNIIMTTFWTESQHYDIKIHKYEMQS